MNNNRKKKTQTPGEERLKSFLDMIAPSVIQFYTDHYICGNTFRSVWALREYPTATDEQAILRHLGEKDGVTLRIYTRQVTPAEEKKIISNAANKNRMKQGNTENLQETVTAASNLQDVTNIIATMHRNREPLLHTAVYLELSAADMDKLKLLQTEVLTELIRSKLNVDKLLLRQKQGFQSVMPSGWNAFGTQYERVLPASSAANLYPMCYSGKTDPRGFLLGRDKYGSNVIIDFDRRTGGRTNSSVLILGNSGQGKSHLLRLLVINALEAGKKVLLLDAEDEYRELTRNLGGMYVDCSGGKAMINPLEPKRWDADGTGTVLAQHISFLRDWLRSYKPLTDAQADTVEILLEQLYRERGITKETDMSVLRHEDFPLLCELYALLERQAGGSGVFTDETLRELRLHLHSLCVGPDSLYFNGHTNIGSGRFVTFGVKSLLEAGQNLRDAMLFNIFSYMNNELLCAGNTVAAIDELYLYLNNRTAIGYIRACMKRARKKESSLLLASQNVEDFLLPEAAELTKPLFSIPAYQFLFHPGTVDGGKYREALQLEECEYGVVRSCARGNCLFKCGDERYNLLVKTPPHKLRCYGTAGGR